MTPGPRPEAPPMNGHEYNDSSSSSNNNINTNDDDDAVLHNDEMIPNNDGNETIATTTATTFPITNDSDAIMAAGYTPLDDLPFESMTTGTSFFSFTHSETIDGNDDEWDDHGNDDDDHDRSALDYHSAADEALRALDEEYSSVLGMESRIHHGSRIQSDTSTTTTTITNDSIPAITITNDDNNANNDNHSTPPSTHPISPPPPTKQPQPPPIARDITINPDAIRRAMSSIHLRSSPQLSPPYPPLHPPLPATHPLIPTRPLNAFRRHTPKSISSTKNLSRSATLAEAIRRLHLFNNKRTTTLLRIDLLGIDHVESRTDDAVRQSIGPFARWMGAAGTERLLMRLIGPGVVGTGGVDVRPAGGSGGGRPRVAMAERKRGLYHEVVGEEEEEEGVDLIVAFNAGIWGYGTWRETLEVLKERGRKREVVMVVTGYTVEEVEDDVEVLASVGGKAIWGVEVNPYGSRERRDVKTAMEGRVYRENSAWVCWSFGKEETENEH